MPDDMRRQVLSALCLLIYRTNEGEEIPLVPGSSLRRSRRVSYVLRRHTFLSKWADWNSPTRRLI